MSHIWVRLFFLGFAVSGAVLAEDAIKVSPAREALLKERVTKFWEPFVTGKFRLSDAYVSEESKDEFYSWPKKRVKSFTIDKIYYADAGKAAKVVTLVEVPMSMMGIGAMDVKQPLETWWRLEKGSWYWFQPKNETRQTPFGKMDSNPASGEAPLIPTGQFIEAPSIEKLQAMVKPDRTAVEFTMGEEKTDTITVKNGMPGSVSLTFDAPASPELTFEVSPRVVPRGGSASLIVRYAPKGKPAADATPVIQIFRLGVAQTGKSYEIRILINPKK